jgi:Tol biopolymer transport system component
MSDFVLLQNGTSTTTSLHMLDIAQGHVRRVTTKEGVSDNSPRWSPDSAHLIFLSSRSGSSQVPSLDLTHKLVSLLRCMR